MTLTEYSTLEAVHHSLEHSLATEENTSFHAPLAEQIWNADKPQDQSEFNINIKNGVATLSGTSASNASSNMVEYLVSRIDEVDVVINLITTE